MLIFQKKNMKDPYANADETKQLLEQKNKLMFINIAKCDILRDLLPFVQLKKREKYPWGKRPIILLHGCFMVPDRAKHHI